MRHARTAWRTSWRALIFDGPIYARTHVEPCWVTSQLCVPSNDAGQTGASLNVRYLWYPVVLLNYCSFIFHCSSVFCCFCCCLCLTMDISMTPCFLVAAHGQLHPPPTYSPPNSRVPCGDLSNVRHEVCALKRTYFVRLCSPSLYAQNASVATQVVTSVVEIERNQ
jgi:hypothetical protein